MVGMASSPTPSIHLLVFRKAMFTSLGYSRMRETGFNTRSIPSQAEWGSGRVWLPNAAKRRKSSSPGRKPWGFVLVYAEAPEGRHVDALPPLRGLGQV